MDELVVIGKRRNTESVSQVSPENKKEQLDVQLQKETREFINTTLTKIYSSFQEEHLVRNELRGVIDKFHPSSKEYVGFLESLLKSFENGKRYDEKSKKWIRGASNFEGKGAFNKAFLEFRNNNGIQLNLYENEEKSKYYYFLEDYPLTPTSILETYEADEFYDKADTLSKAIDNLKFISNDIVLEKEAFHKAIHKTIDDEINTWGKDKLADDRDLIIRNYKVLEKWWLEKVNNETALYTYSGRSLYDVYLNYNLKSLSRFLYYPHSEAEMCKILDDDFMRWNKDRISNLAENKKVYFDQLNIGYLAAIEQAKRSGGDIQIDQAFFDTMQSMHVAFSRDELKRLNTVYDRYSYAEIIGELILQWDGDNDKNDGTFGILKKIQLGSGIFSNRENLFKIEYTGKWNKATWRFLSMLRNDEQFKKSINADLYISHIDKILSKNEKYRDQYEKGSEEYYETYTSFIEQQHLYWSNPVEYWRSQERGRRDFVGVIREKSAYPTISSDTQVERSFISNSANQSSKLNGEIAKWLDISGKTLEQQREIGERLMRLIPKDRIHGVVNEILSNPDIRRNFVEKLNMTEEMLDDEVLFDRIINYETGDQQFEIIKERFFGKLWENKGDVIISFAGELSDFLKEQIGVSALNVRKDFLENIFGFSITPVELPGQKDDVFYFKDQYHPETVYEYRPKTGEIFAQESISLKDGEILFNGGQTDQKRLIYTLKKYSEYLDGVDVLGVLPIGGNRPDSFESLQDELSRNIQRYMHVDVGFTEVQGIHERNDSERMKNEIVDRAREILGITQDQLTESQDGPYYELLLSVINSVQDISRESLAEIRFFFEQFSVIMYDIRNGVSVNEGSIKNPLLKFVVEKTKNLENNGQNFILDVKTKKNWREIDLAFGSILRELIFTDVDGKEKLSIGSIAFLNNAREGSPGHERFVQDVRKRYEELSHPLLTLRDQELSSLEEWRDNAVQGVIRETGSEVADLGHFVRADQKLDREMDKAFELEFDVSAKIPDNPQNDIA